MLVSCYVTALRVCTLVLFILSEQWNTTARHLTKPRNNSVPTEHELALPHCISVHYGHQQTILWQRTHSAITAQEQQHSDLHTSVNSASCHTTMGVQQTNCTITPGTTFMYYNNQYTRCSKPTCTCTMYNVHVAHFSSELLHHDLLLVVQWELGLLSCVLFPTWARTVHVHVHACLWVYY